MGSSIPEKVPVPQTQQPVQEAESVPETKVTLTAPPAAAPAQPEPQRAPLVANIEEDNLPEPTQTCTKKIVPEKVKSTEHRKSIDGLLAVTNGSARELPPLKKVRSQKRMEDLLSQLKENKEVDGIAPVSTTVPTNPSENRLSSRNDLSICEVGEGDESDRFKEKRVKKQRVSKSRNTPGPYF